MGLLNLCGLGLGYAALRHWWSAAACWAATAGLLVVALPVDSDGIPGWITAGYALVLLAAAADGARRGLRTGLAGVPRSRLALPLAVVLVAVPVTGAVGYDAAQDEAVEKELLKRLDRADSGVRKASNGSFTSAQGAYREALRVYVNLRTEHGGTRAAERVPDRLRDFYTRVGAPYEQAEFCDAVRPLKYLRGLRRTVDDKVLGKLATWPDKRLAHSWYECGMRKLEGSASSGSSGSSSPKGAKASARHLNDLMKTFPDSRYATKVKPELDSRISRGVEKLDGDAPCSVATELSRIRSTVRALPSDTASALRSDAQKAVEKGDYACGVDRFKDKRFLLAKLRLSRFSTLYADSPLADRAKDIAIAAEIAQQRAAAGKRLPRAKAPGGARQTMTVSNGGPGEVEMLYTGPVTGSITLKECPECRTFSSRSEGRAKACKRSSVTYPSTTLRLPPGEYHFLYKRKSSTGSSALSPRRNSDTKTIRPAHRYTSCLYVTKSSLPFTEPTR
ncbi:hypothetical protein [Streptomyces sp. 891-h]|uniref:hypothetical protein n=1 Tax=unclassified Streptomyces TaxID=2593676 RepID=UPI001FAB2811|nr:hypothetical protein [Streptomyces sp. 891-h]UNZ20998.1 hypothetical protein HC362_31865 [Streptomyces sp. 891-h]